MSGSGLPLEVGTGLQAPRGNSGVPGPVCGAAGSYRVPSAGLGSGLFQNCPSPRYCACGETGQEGPQGEGEKG